MGLSGRTLGVLGLGNIGRAIAQRGKGFDMRVIAVDINEVEQPPYVDELYRLDGLSRMLSEADFQAIGGMRGIGWAILFQDPVTGRLTNQWITLHQDGIPAGFKPLLVMDVWEHAFMRDYKATEKAKYIEAFFSNLDWRAVESRLAKGRHAAAA